MNDQRVKTDNRVTVSIEEAEAINCFMGEKHIWSGEIMDWNHLMPVVQKIRTLFQDNKLFEKGKEKWSLIALCLETTELASVYLAVVQFIHWYNENKPGKSS